MRDSESSFREVFQSNPHVITSGTGGIRCEWELIAAGVLYRAFEEPVKQLKQTRVDSVSDSCRILESEIPSSSKWKVP